MYFRAQKKTASEISMNEPIDTDKDGNPLTYLDIISVDDTIADDIDTKTKAEKALFMISSELTERERTIMIMRYGLDGRAPMAQREVAEVMGISRSYVSRIEKAALEKMEKKLR